MKLSRTKLYMRLLFGALFMVLLAFCSSISLAASSADTLKQEPTINVPLSNWNELKGNLIEADSLIKASKLSLNEAQSLTVKQANELNELRNINTQQANELQKASTLLNEQATSLDAASNSLDELRSEIKRNKRTEQRLKRQRATWAVVAGAITVLAAVK